MTKSDTKKFDEFKKNFILNEIVDAKNISGWSILGKWKWNRRWSKNLKTQKEVKESKKSFRWRQIVRFDI